MTKSEMRDRVLAILGLQSGDLDATLLDDRMDRIYQFDLVNQVPGLGEVALVRFDINGAAELTFLELQGVMSYANDAASVPISNRELKHLREHHWWLDETVSNNSRRPIEFHTDKSDFYTRFWDAFPHPVTGVVADTRARIDGILVEGERVIFWPRPTTDIVMYSDVVLYRAPIPSGGLTDRLNTQIWTVIWGTARGFASDQGQDEVEQKALQRYQEFLSDLLQQTEGDPKVRRTVGDRW